jgi:hypothetical protein
MWALVAHNVRQLLAHAGSCELELQLVSEQVASPFWAALPPTNALRNMALQLANTKVICPSLPILACSISAGLRPLACGCTRFRGAIYPPAQASLLSPGCNLFAYWKRLPVRLYTRPPICKSLCRGAYTDRK